MIEDSSSHSQRQENAERLRLFFESISDSDMIMLDADGRILLWNPGAERNNGYSAEEMVGSNFARLYRAGDGDAKKPERMLEAAVASGVAEEEVWRIRKDGTRFPAHVVLTALRHPASGQLLGFGQATRDLTEVRRAEKRLRESEEQFRLLVESVREYALFMLDPEGKVTTWNAGAKKLKGYSADEIIGQSFERFYTAADQAAGKPGKILAKAKAAGVIREQGPRVRKDGTTFEAEVLITAVRDDSGELRGFSKVTRDITDQIRNRELETAKIAAEKASEAKDRFLAILSHELRTPLTPVVASASYVAENALTMSQSELLQELGTIRRNALLEAQLIDDLLDLTRISRGKIALRMERVDLHAILLEVLEMCEEEIRAKGLEISKRLGAREYEATADGARLRQIFWNLLSNAVKFTPSGGKVSVRTMNRGDDWVLEVTDSGVGLEREEIGRIFDAFEQGEQTVAREFGGLGLGLAITRSLVEMHQGTIAAESEGKGKGATFTVQLPLIGGAEAPARDGRGAKEGERALKSLRILLVEDHEDTRRVLSRLLLKRGHTVTTATSVKTALEQLQREEFDVLLSDIGLPDASGHQLLRLADERRPPKAIALSGFGTEGDVQRSLDAGFDHHVTKPVEFQRLMELLREMFA